MNNFLKITRLFAILLLAMTSLILSSCTGGGGSSSISSRVLQAIEVTPSNPIVHIGTRLQLTATGIYSDNTTEDITSQVNWLSSEPTIAVVSNEKGSKGVLTPVASGKVLITANLNGVLSQNLQSASVTVSDAALKTIQVTAEDLLIAKSTTTKFTATGIYDDNHTQDITASVTWSSSDTSVATIANVTGIATAIAKGKITISATSEGIIGKSELTVTDATLTAIEVTADKSVIAKKTEAKFTATGIFSDKSNQDITSQVTWSSSNTSVAAIETTGIATGLEIGETIISAKSGSISSTAKLEVTSATLKTINIEASELSVAQGTKNIQFRAIGIYSDKKSEDITNSVVWSSSKEAIAKISNAEGSQGLASAESMGETTIKAIMGDGDAAISGSVSFTVTAATLNSIEVTPVNPELAKGYKKQFKATGIYSDDSTQDLTSQVTWISSKVAVAEIENGGATPGLATTTESGSTTIKALLGNISSNEAVLTVTNAELLSIQVSPFTPKIANGYRQQFTAMGIFSDGNRDITNDVTWSSDKPEFATISNADGSRGNATTISVGSTIITATSGNVSGSTELTVTNARLESIQITPINPTLAKGDRKQFTATGIFSDNTTTQDLTSQVTWISSESGVADIGNHGNAIGIGIGTTTITAETTDGNDTISGSTQLTVSDAQLLSIAIDTNQVHVPKGLTWAFTAIGTYTDGPPRDITNDVTWSSSDEAIVAISNADGSRGNATTISVGSATIKAEARDGGQIISSDDAEFIVTDTRLLSISVTPESPTQSKGYAQQFSAIGYFSDGERDITNDVTWTSSDVGVAAISNEQDNWGNAKGEGVGTATITATAYDGTDTISGSAKFTVSEAELQSIEISPVDPSIPYGGIQYFTAMGKFSDGERDITDNVTWTSSNTSIAQISNAATSKGMATSVGMGTATITASATDGSGKTSNTNLTVAAGEVAYVTNQGSKTVSKCLINSQSGTLENCINSGATNLSGPYGLAFYQMSGVLYAYIVNDNSSIVTSGTVTSCLVGSDGQLSGCKQAVYTGTTDLQYISFDSNGHGYINNQRSGASSVKQCNIASNGLLSSCNTIITYSAITNWGGVVVYDGWGYILGTDGIYRCIYNTVTGALEPCAIEADTVGKVFDARNITFYKSGTTYTAYTTDADGILACSLVPNGGVLSSCSRVTGSSNITSPSSIVFNSTGTTAYVTSSSTNTVTQCSLAPGGTTFSNCKVTGSGFNQPRTIVIRAAN